MARKKSIIHICGCQVSNKIDLAIRKKSVHNGVKYLCRQCNYQATSKCNLAEYKIVLVYDGVKYHYRKCNYEAITKGSLVRQYMKESNTLEDNATIKQLQRGIW